MNHRIISSNFQSNAFHAISKVGHLKLKLEDLNPQIIAIIVANLENGNQRLRVNKNLDEKFRQNVTRVEI